MEANYMPGQKSQMALPYGGRLSREKTFVCFAVSEPSVKVFSANICGHTHIIIGRTGTIGESFFPRNSRFGPKRETFLPRNVSAVYTVSNASSISSLTLSIRPVLTSNVLKFRTIINAMPYNWGGGGSYSIYSSYLVCISSCHDDYSASSFSLE